MVRLGINIDHIATLRQARHGVEPDPVAAALVAELAGADGIVAHLREDRRHIQDRDIRRLRESVKTHLNLEMAATPDMIRTALEVRPDLVTLVPERREELTTEGGLDVIKHREYLRNVLIELQCGNIPVSLFIDPDPDQIRTASEIGARIVEIHTGRYAEAKSRSEIQKEWADVARSARQGRDLGMQISAGHGLNYQNVGRIASIPEVEELNIGHSIIARAAMTGLETAVRDMKALMHPQPSI
jgi:pyridoxine 5-phosphate synthase